MLPIPEYDQLHVISDLHMGGRAGFQIFTTGKLLAAFIDSLTEGEAEQEIGLCINGDTVDFLAEPNARYFDPLGAPASLDRIVSDPSFASVWEALKRFTNKPHRHLILTLGNHDLELALPWVQKQLLDHLSGGTADARGRVTCSFNGEGFLARVGGASILCLHGNEFDTFNLTDHERIRRIGRDLSYGRPGEEWTPNAGTKLVIDVMNEIKGRFPFVDVLKPEPAVVALLWALDQTTWPRLARVLAVGERLSWDAVRKATGFLSAEEAAEARSAMPVPQPPVRTGGDPDALARLLAQTFEGSDPASSAPIADQLLDGAERHLTAGIDPLTLVSDQGRDQLGVGSALWAWVQDRPRDEQVWKALQELAGDKSFDVTHYDDTAERADSLVGTEIAFVVVGHTHKARAFRRKRGAGLYFNSGTWAGLIRLTPEQLRSAESFKPVFEELESSHLLSDLGDLLQPRPTIVSFHASGRGTTSSLRQASFDGADLKLTTLFER